MSSRKMKTDFDFDVWGNHIFKNVWNSYEFRYQSYGKNFQIFFSRKKVNSTIFTSQRTVK